MVMRCEETTVKKFNVGGIESMAFVIYYASVNIVGRVRSSLGTSGFNEFEVLCALSLAGRT